MTPTFYRGQLQQQSTKCVFARYVFVSSKLCFICKVLYIWDFFIPPFNLPFEEGRDLIFKGSFVAWHLESELFLSLMFIMTYGLFM